MQRLFSGLFFIIAIGGYERRLINDWPNHSLTSVASNWTGKWSGLLKTFPQSSTATNVQVMWDIGLYPIDSSTCSTWRNTYSENGVVQTYKNYRLCRGNDSNLLYIDEDNDMVIVAQWIDNILVHPFRYNGYIAVNLIRMHGNNLEEEVITFADEPVMENVISRRMLTLQRLTMTRMPAD